MELAQLQLLQRYVGNRTLARVFDKGFWIFEDDRTYTWHKGTDTAGFVRTDLPDHKSKGSWFAWPVFRRSVAAPTAGDASAKPAAESASESPAE